MPGQRKRRQFEEALRAAADEEGLEPLEGLDLGETMFFTLVAGGASFEEIAARFGMSRTWLYTWLASGGRKEERWAALDRARSIAAFAHADRAGSVLEEADELILGSIQKAKSLSEYHKWRAETGNRRAFGRQADVQVNVGLDLGGLHLESLTADLPPLPEPEPNLLEAEVVEDDDEDE